jgi:hypothetical protein
LIGIIESLATGFLEPHPGSGCGLRMVYLVLVVALLLRPCGHFGARPAVRV